MIAAIDYATPGWATAAAAAPAAPTQAGEEVPRWGGIAEHAQYYTLI